MVMAYVWLGMLGVSVLYGAFTGNMEAVSSAVTAGASEAVSLCLSMAGPLCLWSGFLETLRQGGALDWLSGLFAPLLRRLFPCSMADGECARALSANFAANLLGLGNAATPAGIRAARRMSELPGATDECARLVVLNTASIQLLPTTVAAVRASAGASSPMDILPCVWVCSLASVCVGLLTEKVLARLGL